MIKDNFTLDTSGRLYAFTFYPWAVQTLGHLLDSLHDLFQNRFLLKKYDFTSYTLKCFFGGFQSLINQQKKLAAISGTNFFNLSPKILWMPKTHQFNHNFSAFILIVNQNEVRDHHCIA